MLFDFESDIKNKEGCVFFNISILNSEQKYEMDKLIAGPKLILIFNL